MTFSEDSAETDPQISPDGEWLYFIRKNRQSSAVWRKSLSGEKEAPITGEKQFAPSKFFVFINPTASVLHS